MIWIVTCGFVLAFLGMGALLLVLDVEEEGDPTPMPKAPVFQERRRVPRPPPSPVHYYLMRLRAATQ